ncbi:MAG: peptide deformylase [Acidobacteria bacterium]|nr:peptide deformylase [Acidobacteriota bacterium]
MLSILKFGAPELKKPSAPVEEFNGQLRHLVDEMVETMYAARGIGLAAPQVGVNLRLVIVDISRGREPEQLMVIANPEIVSTEGQQSEEEGCLSLPDFSGSVPRPWRVRVRGLNPRGDEFYVEGEGLLARAFCHEIDHVNGTLFIDRLSGLKRDLIKRKIRKLISAGRW